EVAREHAMQRLRRAKYRVALRHDQRLIGGNRWVAVYLWIVVPRGLALELEGPPRDAQLQPHGGGGETGLEQEVAGWIVDRRLRVDLLDQPSAPAFRCARGNGHQLAPHGPADARSFGLII